MHNDGMGGEVAHCLDCLTNIVDFGPGSSFVFYNTY